MTSEKKTKTGKEKISAENWSTIGPPPVKNVDIAYSPNTTNNGRDFTLPKTSKISLNNDCLPSSTVKAEAPLFSWLTTA
jgi:hypothetical protein